MNQAQKFRFLFLKELFRGIRFVWPVVSGLIMLIALLGLLVGYLEGWRAQDGVYFAFVTALTVGYGDLVPMTPLARVAAIAIGFSGILLTGVVAAVSVHGLQRAIPKPPSGQASNSAPEISPERREE